MILFAGKMQHSVWVAEVINSCLEVSNASLSDVIPAGVLPKQFSFRRIWQGKGAQTAACKVPVNLLIFLVSLRWILGLKVNSLEIIVSSNHLCFPLSVIFNAVMVNSIQKKRLCILSSILRMKLEHIIVKNEVRALKTIICLSLSTCLKKKKVFEP